jgi:hypothetical protein
MADETTAMVLVPREPNYAMLRAVENEFAVRIDDPSATAVSLSREETRGIWAIMLAASPAVCDPAQVGGSVGPAAGFSLFLDPKAAGMLSDFIGDVDDDREASAIVLSIGEVEGDGNEPAEYGLRVTMADYPEEGSIVLVEMDRAALGGSRETTPTNHQDVARSLADQINRAVEVFGSLRRMSEVLDIDVGYLSRLRSGEKTEPGDDILKKLGLRRVVAYEPIYKATPLAPRTKSA